VRVVADHDPVAKRLGHAICFEHQSAGRIALDRHPHRSAFVAMGGTFGTQFHEITYTSFVPRAPRLDTLAEPGFLLLEFLVEALEGEGLGVQGLCLLFAIKSTTACPRSDPSATAPATAVPATPVSATSTPREIAPIIALTSASPTDLYTVVNVTVADVLNLR